MRHRTVCFLIRGNMPAEVLLGLKKKGFGAGKITGIGGKVERGETLKAAAVRELEEETGIKAVEQDLLYMGQLTFLFPACPAWDQVVHLFHAVAWMGDPAESNEMKPEWFRVDQLPFERMWQDAPHWLPNVLAKEKVRMRIVFGDDNETVREVSGEGI
ncbi:MAG: 8-oxo-dGTP diphosphatase [Candidatus Aureabacteria bacterium]|nr:8-oxo-dGTP diphosphatase [Candidatus Auribacterota bacterium]